IGAKVGDHVEVSMDNMNVLKAAVMAYIIPLIALLVGTIGTYYILGAIGMTTGVEAISGLVGICLTIICYLYLKKNDKKFRDSREFIPVITRILIDL
ncbi:SoxR reducing system RseC family protein, partial [Clostridioides difficile]